MEASHGTHLQSEGGEGARWEYLPGQIQVQHCQPPLAVTLQAAGLGVFSTAVSEIAVLIKRSNSRAAERPEPGAGRQRARGTEGRLGAARGRQAVPELGWARCSSRKAEPYLKKTIVSHT